MDSETEFTDVVYRYVLQRKPSQKEVDFWVGRLKEGLSPAEFMTKFFEGPEYKARMACITGLAHPPGHYYSPINAPAQLNRAAMERRRDSDVQLLEIDLRLEEQGKLWHEMLPALSQFPFPAEQSPHYRYYSKNPVYGEGDALILFGMISRFRPKRIIEIGSGFSSACMLDSCEFLNLQTKLTFIEPYPDRLNHLLLKNDRERVTVIESAVQRVDPEMFRELEAGDICFIDSTHVMKAESDVNFELFEILPRLKPGVVVHFHDVFYPLEYHVGWIFDLRYSWNEIYAIRAFLMYNTKFDVIFFNDAFARKHRSLVDLLPEQRAAHFASQSGGGLWLVRKA